MTMPDLGPAADRMAALVRGVPDDALDRPTPCADTSVGDLLDHIGALARAFTSAARKDGDADGPPPPASAANLEPDWRSRTPQAVRTMADAWRDPVAWEGMTRAGGLDLPGEVAGIVALDELVLHGWDLARSLGEPFECDPAALEAVHGFVQQFSGPDAADQRHGLFGPVVPVPDGAPLLDRVLGLSGRDPAWAAG